MLATSEEILSAWLSPARQLAVRVQVDQSSYGSEDVTSLSFDSGSISGEVYQIGSTYMNTVQIVFPSIIETIKEDQEVIPELGILVDGEYHYSKLGHFFITEFNRDRNAKTTTITASDKMIYMEGAYESKLAYSKPYREVALEIANLAGVEINQASFASLGTLAIKKPVGYTHRQAIGLIAQFEGGFASFNRDGELEIRRLRPTEFEVTPESYLLKGFSKNENAYRIGGITVRIGEEETDVLRVGSTNGSQIELENKVMTQTLLNNIWDLVKDLNYFPFELKWRGCPLLEAGDWMYVADRDGKRYSVPNLSYGLTFNGGLSGDSKATTNSSSQATYKYRGSLKQRVDWLNSILSANNWNSNYYESTEPPNPKEGDTWFKPNGKDTEIWMYEKNAEGNLEWVFKISTATNPELIEAIEENKKIVEDAKEAADAAEKKGDEAIALGRDVQNQVNVLDQVANAAKEQSDIAAEQSKKNLELINATEISLKDEIEQVQGYTEQQISTVQQTIEDYKILVGKTYAKDSDVQSEFALLRTGLEGFQATVEKNYVTNTKLASQIASTESAIKLDVQTWTNNILSEYATIQLTDSKIDLAVADKVTNAQFSVYADQVTSLITDRKPNLVLNSDFREGTARWGGTGLANLPIATFSETERNKIGLPLQKYLRVTKASLAGANAYPIQIIANPETFKGKMLRFSLWYMTAGGGYSNGSPVQCYIRYTLNGVNKTVSCTGRSDLYLDVVSGWSNADCMLDFRNLGTADSLSDIRVTMGFIDARFLTDTQRVGMTGFLATEDGNLYDWGYNYVISQSYSQFLQLQDQIDLRVKEDELISAINLQAGKVLIQSGTNLLMVTPDTTYIQNATIKEAAIADLAVTNAKIAALAVGEANIKDLAVTNAKIGKLAVGTANIGDLAVTNAKLGNLSVSGAKIQDATISSAKIISLDVNRLSGNIANFVKSYWTDAFGNQISITASAIEFVTSSATARITAGGLRIFSSASGTASANFAVGKWKDINDNVTSALGIYVGSSSTVSSGTDFTAFTDKEGKTYMIYAGSGMDYGETPNITTVALNIFKFTRFNEDVTFRGTYTNIYGTLTFRGMTNASIQFAESKQTMNFRVGGGVTDGSYFWFNQKVLSAGSFSSTSLLSKKDIKSEYQQDALEEICKTQIMEYEYKNRPGERQLSPIIDDIHRKAVYYLPDIITDGMSVNIYAMSSLAWLAIKQLNAKTEALNAKIEALERKLMA